jgi:hypothetical protein
MARSAGLGQRRKTQVRREKLVASGSEKNTLENGKNLTQFGHPLKSIRRASLRSDNCPNIPECCPNILESVSELIGIRNYPVCHKQVCDK